MKDRVVHTKDEVIYKKSKIKDEVISFFSSNKKIVSWIVGVIFFVFLLCFGYYFIFARYSEENKVLVQLQTDIEDYLEEFGESFSRNGQIYEFEKCPNGGKKCSKRKSKKVGVQFIGTYTDDGGKLQYEVKICNLATAGYIDELEFVNPTNGKKCFSIGAGHDINPIIMTYVDADGDYYYYVDLTRKNTGCNFKSKKAFITNFPDNLVKTLKRAKVDLPKQLKNR